MKDPTLRITHRLRDGREVESEVERRGSRIRLRSRLVRDGLVTAAFRVTGRISDVLTRRQEVLPAEFADNPEMPAATFQPIEELWRHRLQLMRRVGIN